MYYNCSGQIQCKGCLRNFKPAIFKGSHITQCKQLSAMGYNQKKEHSVYEKDQPMTVKVSEVDNEGFTKFLICYCGITWFTSVAIHQIQAVVRQLTQSYPNLRPFVNPYSVGVEKFLHPGDFNLRLNSAEGLEIMS